MACTSASPRVSCRHTAGRRPAKGVPTGFLLFVFLPLRVHGARQALHFEGHCAWQVDWAGLPQVPVQGGCVKIAKRPAPGQHVCSHPGPHPLLGLYLMIAELLGMSCHQHCPASLGNQVVSILAGVHAALVEAQWWNSYICPGMQGPCQPMESP